MLRPYIACKKGNASLLRKGKCDYNCSDCSSAGLRTDTREKGEGTHGEKTTQTMLQASYTRLLNSNNFAAIGDNDRVYNTTPEGLTELRTGLADPSAKLSPADYIGVANYCKSLVLNPALNSFNLQVDDVMHIWETRLLCMLIVSILAKKSMAGAGSSQGLVSDKMLQFEASNVLDQVAHLNNTANSSNNNAAANTNGVKRPRKEVKLDRQFANMLMWMKHNGRDIALLDHYYKEAFRARTTDQQDQSYLNRLQFAILAVLLRRKELFTAYTIVSQENPLTAETMSLVQDRIENNARDTDIFCLGLSLDLGVDRPGEYANNNPLYLRLAQALGLRT